MKLNKKGQIGGFTVGQLGTILLVLFIIVVVLAIILGWASPAFGKTLEWLSFW